MTNVIAFVTMHGLFCAALLVAVVTSLLTVLSSVWRRPHTSRTDLEKAAATFSEQQKQRMWEHFLHDDDLFNDRLNFLLVFESVLLGVGIGMLTSHSKANLVLQGFAVFGLVVTLLWSYIQSRHKHGLDALKRRTRTLFPEYSLGAIARGKPPFSATWLLTYPLPWLVAAVWLSLLFLLGA